MHGKSPHLPSFHESRHYSSSGRTKNSASLKHNVMNFMRILKSPAMKRILLLFLFIIIIISSFFMGRASLPQRPPIRLSSYEKSNITFFKVGDSPYKTWAIALKTGKDVALKRTPIQLMTFLAPVRDQVIMIGEAPGVYVGDVKMIDVVSDQPADELSFAIPPTMKHDPSAGHLEKRSAEELVPDEDSKGWKSDAKKNIPGFKVLYDHFPDAEWYLMIDDDSYVFLDTLKEALDKYDPLEPHYLGAATNFIGCDGVSKWGDSPYFAHGGSGIVVSRGALLKMLPLLDTCIDKYKDCWAGDIRLGLCLRDAGVLVKNAGYFSPDSPTNNFNFSYPCAAPKTFHHLLPEQVQKLFELEQVARTQNQRVLLVDIFKAFLDDEAKLNYDRPGGTFKDTKTPTADDCKALCQETSKCVAYTFENGGCHLKATAPPIKRRNTGAVTGLITDHFVCNDRNKW